MKAKVFLADDDDKEAPAALGAALASENYEIIVATNGRDAIEHFRRFGRV